MEKEVDQLGEAINRLCEEASDTNVVLAALLTEVSRWTKRAGFTPSDALVLLAQGLTKVSVNPLTGGDVNAKTLLTLALLKAPAV